MSPQTNMVNLTKKDLKKLTKCQLIALLMKNEAKNEVKAPQKPIPKPRADVKSSINQFEDTILPPPMQFRDKQRVDSYEDIILHQP